MHLLADRKADQWQNLSSDKYMIDVFTSSHYVIF